MGIFRIVDAVDVKLFNMINRNFTNPVFDFIMPYISEIGTGQFIFIVAVLLLFLKKRKRMAGILLFAGLTVSYYVAGFLKDFLMRPRPFSLISEVHLLGSASGFSFPSGHTTVAFMAAAVLSRFFGKTSVFFSIAGLVAFSRVYVGVHYVSDTIAGAALGSAIGYVIMKIAERSQGAVDS